MMSVALIKRRIRGACKVDHLRGLVEFSFRRLRDAGHPLTRLHP